MHKSSHVIYHQDKLRSYRKWKYHKCYKKLLHKFKQFEMVRFPRRIARWRALILVFGGRNKIT